MISTSRRYKHTHVGRLLLKNTVVMTIGKHVKIDTLRMYELYVEIRINMHMNVKIRENTYALFTDHGPHVTSTHVTPEGANKNQQPMTFDQH
jgi:hypothetical protein